MPKPRILCRKSVSSKRPVNKILSGQIKLDIIENIKQEPPDINLLDVKEEITNTAVKRNGSHDKIKLDSSQNDVPEFSFFPIATDLDFDDDIDNENEQRADEIALNLKYMLHDHPYAEPPSLLPVTWVKCEFCTFKTKSLYGLKRHLCKKHKQVQESEDEILLLKCSLCDFKTNKYEKIKAHLSRKHSNRGKIEKWYYCFACKYKSKRIYDYNMHVYHKHTSADKVMWEHCPYCFYKGKSMRLLKAHLTRRHWSTIY